MDQNEKSEGGETKWVLDLLQVVEGSDALLGSGDAPLGVGQRQGLVLAESVRIVHQRPPLLHEEARERLVLRAHHPELLGHPRRHFERLFGARDVGLVGDRRIGGGFFPIRVWGLGARRESPPSTGGLDSILQSDAFGSWGFRVSLLYISVIASRNFVNAG